MSNTNVKIKTSNSQSWFNGRKYHNNRNTNLSDSDFKNDECINIVEIVNKDLGLTSKNLVETEEESKILRSDITRKLSANNSKLGKYQKEIDSFELTLDNLINEDKIDSKEFSSVQKKLSKKMLTYNKAKNKSNDLEILRNSIAAKKVDNTNKNRNDFVELTFSITKAPKNLRRDLNYANDVLKASKEFFQTLGLKMEIHSYSTHLEQSSPHVHILGSYENSDSSFNKDLQDHFGKNYNYYSLNNSFNNFVRNHKSLKKYEHVKNLETITRGGKWEYLKNVGDYKKNSKELKKDITAYVKNIKAKKSYGLVQESREDILEKELIEVTLDNALKGSISDNLVESNEMLTKDNKNAHNALNHAHNDARLLKNSEIKVKDLAKSLEFEKNRTRETNNKLDLANKEVQRLKNQYEPKEKSHHRNRR